MDITKTRDEGIILADKNNNILIKVPFDINDKAMGDNISINIKLNSANSNGSSYTMQSDMVNEIYKTLKKYKDAGD